MLWAMGVFFAPGSKIKSSKKKQQTIEDADLCGFSMPVSSRYKTQKSNTSGPGFYVSGLSLIPPPQKNYLRKQIPEELFSG